MVRDKSCWNSKLILPCQSRMVSRYEAVSRWRFPMTKTGKCQASCYLILFIIVAVLAVAMIPATPSALAAGSSDASATAQATSNPVRGRYNGRIVFTSDRHNRALSIWSMNPDGSSPTRLTDDKSRTEKLPSFSPVYDGSYREKQMQATSEISSPAYGKCNALEPKFSFALCSSPGSCVQWPD